MDDKNQPAAEPEEDKARLVRDDDGGARLVPGRNIVEGEMAEEDGQEPKRDL